MTGLWFKTREFAENLYKMKIVSDLFEFVRNVASGEMSYTAIIAEAKCFQSKLEAEEQ